MNMNMNVNMRVELESWHRRLQHVCDMQFLQIHQILRWILFNKIISKYKKKKKAKFHDLSPGVNYIDRATAAWRRS
jgi:hypothetical protein